ncbi:NADPH-dependent F420 reductase [Mucilaginibacter myungsuensis]|uniref:NADPH-dependent F420 reductase n=1 Tax=Mucilaginibacter myungsuensis TaxID=649104 RepID=A0A929L235_9SPHI|nr:NADPH-dependent F420 reductase [Mucilaginibacter myungsuensis]MBE9663074.1 NADPH-dependent F420 reductase [Mucilaginibacter myungsuensis]MDN3598709.1 NADPH-dependent F420 reductase [Mucilaginibacter myungsuensis]
MSQAKNTSENSYQISTVGIIGTGQIGTTLARLSVRAGINVVLSNSRGPESLRSLIAELGPLAKAGSISEAIEAADIVVATIPLPNYQSLPAGELAGKTVIDTMNYYPIGYNIEDLDNNKFTSSELVQQHLIGAEVVKAFNNIPYPHIALHARPQNDPGRTTIPIAGDDEEAKGAVEQFINTIGYDTVDAGPLAESWRFEPMTPIYYWPYAPVVPEGTPDAEARRIYQTTFVDPLRPAAAQTLLKETDRKVPVGGRLDILPPIHLKLYEEFTKGRY